MGLIFRRSGKGWCCPLLFLLLMPACCVAELKERHWSISPVLGVHSPALTQLNEKEFKVPIPVSGALVIGSEGSSTNVNFQLNNPLPDIKYGTEAGIEFQLELTERDSMLLGFSSWEGGVTSVIQTTLPFQGVLSDVIFTRSADVSYFQYYLGWQRDLFQRQKKYNIYSRLTLHEMFDVDFNENMVFAFRNGAADSFKRIADMGSQATGVLMFHLGLGGEYFVRDWLSFGMDAGYISSVRKFNLTSPSIKQDFQDQDNVDITLPQANLQGKLSYLQGIGQDNFPQYKEIELRLDGWRTLFHVNIYF